MSGNVGGKRLELALTSYASSSLASWKSSSRTGQSPSSKAAARPPTSLYILERALCERS